MAASRGASGRADESPQAKAEQVVNLSEPFIRRPVMTVVLTVSAILFGVLAYMQLPVNDLPAVDYPVIQVQRRLSRRDARDDGEQRRHAARAAVHADPRAGD